MGSNNTVITKERVITDTIYVDKPYQVIEIEYIEVPIEVIIYKSDTILRNKVENDTIITGINIVDEEIEIHSITPLGVPLIKTYNLPESIDNIKINNKGDLNILPKKDKTKSKRRFRRASLVGVFILGIVLGSR